MTKLICALLLGLSLLWPNNCAQAADYKLNISLARQDDGTTFGELWYNDKVIWRLKICADGAEPVSGRNGTNTTLVIPDIVNGLFLVKLHNQ